MKDPTFQRLHLIDFDQKTTTLGQNLCPLYRECPLYGASVSVRLHFVSEKVKIYVKERLQTGFLTLNSI